MESSSWDEEVPSCYNEDKCLHCRSPTLVTDWAQGDRVCTNCGIVHEEHLRDDRPEWREFKDDPNEMAKGLPSAARCGLVPVDETRYWGGLQPTILSKHVFGGGSDVTRKRLYATSRRLDIVFGKQHKQAIQEAKLSRQIRNKRIKTEQHEEDGVEEEHVRPEYEHLVQQEEEAAQQSRDALYAEKWSIERAILLHGQHDDVATHSPMHHSDEDRDDLQSRLDAPLLKASAELHRAYIMLQSASRKLHLPDLVLHEATAMLCRYATRRDGILVRGVSSRMSNSKEAADKKEAAERLREYNKQKQHGALGAALLFLTARKLGWTRSLAEVCSSFQPENGVKVSEAFIKSKHCSRAMNEVRALFPHYGRPAGPVQNHATETGESTANFVEHATRKLELPPVAVASIKTLVFMYCNDQEKSETESMAKLSTICAAMSLFVCLAGASLQRLAQQAQTEPAKRTCPPSDDQSNKRIKLTDGGAQETDNDDDTSRNDTGALFEEDSSSDESTPPAAAAEPPETKPFDVFSHPAIEDPVEEKKRYEMRRIWDAWLEQMPWSRSIGRVEQSCGVSRNTVLTFYKTKIFPRRHAFLEVLQDSASSNNEDSVDNTLKDTPLASVLLKNISAAAPLINSRGQL